MDSVIDTLARLDVPPALVAALALPSAAQYVDPYEHYTGDNLILEGGSFEVRQDGFGGSRKMYWQHHQGDDFAFVPLAYDSRPGYAMHGRRSLRITNETEDCVSLDFHWMKLEEGVDYVVSLWGKAEKSPGEPPDLQMSVTAKIIGKTPAPQGGYWSEFQHTFPLDSDWGERKVTGTFRIDRRMIASRPPSTSGLTDRGGVGSSFMCCSSTPQGVSARNGVRPVTILYMMTPHE